MDKDYRYKSVKAIIETGRITTFQEIFQYIPKTIIASELRTNNNRMSRLIQHPDHMTFGEIYHIAKLIEVDPRILCELIFTQISRTPKTEDL